MASKFRPRALKRVALIVNIAASLQWHWLNEEEVFKAFYKLKTDKSAHELRCALFLSIKFIKIQVHTALERLSQVANQMAKLQMSDFDSLIKRCASISSLSLVESGPGLLNFADAFTRQSGVRIWIERVNSAGRSRCGLSLHTGLPTPSSTFQPK